MAEVNIIFLALALLAEIIGTIGGFGSSVFFVPIGNFFFTFQTVLGITAIFHLFSNISKIVLFRNGIDIKLLINIGIPAVIFVIIGGILAKYLDSKYLEIFLGIFLIVLSSIFLYFDKLEIKAKRKQSIIGGSLSGLFAGLLGTGGAIRGLTMAAFNLEKNVFLATSAFIDFFVDLTRSVVYFQNGFINKEIIIYLPFLLIIGILGTYIGKLILAKISQEKFKKISLILILCIGLTTLIKVLYFHFLT